MTSILNLYLKLLQEYFKLLLLNKRDRQRDDWFVLLFLMFVTIYQIKILIHAHSGVQTMTLVKLLCDLVVRH